MNSDTTFRTLSPTRRRPAGIRCRAFTSTLLLLCAGVSHAQTEVRDLDNAARQPFQAELASQDIPTIQELNTFQLASVPAGKRLVIEHVSFRVAGGELPPPENRPAALHAVAYLETTADGVRGRHELSVDRLDLGRLNRNLAVASQPIRAYADPASQVFIRIAGASEVSDALLVHLAISGHCVDVP